MLYHSLTGGIDSFSNVQAFIVCINSVTSGILGFLAILICPALIGKLDRLFFQKISQRDFEMIGNIKCYRDIHIFPLAAMHTPHDRRIPALLNIRDILSRQVFIRFNPPRGFIPVYTLLAMENYSHLLDEFQPSKRIHSGFYCKRFCRFYYKRKDVSTLQEDSFRFLRFAAMFDLNYFQYASTLQEDSFRFLRRCMALVWYRRSVSTLQEDSFRFLLFAFVTLGWASIYVSTLQEDSFRFLQGKGTN